MTAPAARSFNVILANRQRSRAINLRSVCPIVQSLLRKLPGIRAANLGISLVAASEMTRLNETFLQHAGSTDVITFDYSEPGTRNSKLGTDLHGEIFICMDEAITQARRFRTSWQAEIVRYVVHGVLHLRGHDDHCPAARREMKRAENRLLRSLAVAFDFRQLAQPRPLGRKSQIVISRPAFP